MASPMPDPTHELLARYVMLDREREVAALARARAAAPPSGSLRSRFAARLARLALVIDREAASTVAPPARQPMEEHGG